MGEQEIPDLGSVLEEFERRAGYEVREDLYRDLAKRWGDKLKVIDSTYDNWVRGGVKKTSSWVPLVQLGVMFAERINERTNDPDWVEFTDEDLNRLVKFSRFEASLDELIAQYENGEFDDEKQSAVRGWLEFKGRRLPNQPDRPTTQPTADRRTTLPVAVAAIATLVLGGLFVAARGSNNDSVDTAADGETSTTNAPDPAAPAESEDEAIEVEPITATAVTTSSTTTTQPQATPPSTAASEPSSDTSQYLPAGVVRCEIPVDSIPTNPAGPERIPAVTLIPDLDPSCSPLRIEIVEEVEGNPPWNPTIPVCSVRSKNVNQTVYYQFSGQVNGWVRVSSDESFNEPNWNNGWFPFNGVTHYPLQEELTSTETVPTKIGRDGTSLDRIVFDIDPAGLEGPFIGGCGNTKPQNFPGLGHIQFWWQP